jgi:hypothetical protein
VTVFCRPTFAFLTFAAMFVPSIPPQSRLYAAPLFEAAVTPTPSVHMPQ